MADFATILAATQLQDNTVRNQAEAALREIESSNFGGYMLALSSELQEESRPAGVRQVAGLMIKNALDAENSRTADALHQRWLSLSVPERDGVKNNLVMSLSASHPKASFVAAQAIAKVGKIEIPHHAWPDLVTGLVETAMTPTVPPGVKSASVNTLGLICEDILETDVFSQEEIDMILAAIVTCMQDGEEADVRRLATEAMYNALDFAESNFGDDKAARRDAIMGAIIARATDANAIARRWAFDCMTRVGDIYYRSIEPYIDQLAHATSTAALNDENDMAVRAVEFWTAIAEEESDLADDDADNRHYVVRHLEPLAHMLTTLMTRVDEEHDDQSYTTAQAAGVCLETCALVAKNALVPIVMAFIGENFANPDWHARDACTVAFGSILEGPDQEFLKSHIDSALPIMLSRVVGDEKDASPVVRDSTAWTVCKIIELHFGIIDITAHFHKILETASLALGDEARVAARAAKIVNNLAEHMGDYESDGKNPLSDYFSTLAGQLIARAQHPDFSDHNLRVACYEAVCNMVSHASPAEHDFLLDTLKEVVGKLEASLTRAPTTADEKLDLESQQITSAGLLHALIIYLDEEMVPFAPYLTRLLVSMLDSSKATAAEEALNCINSLAEAVGEAFADQLPSLMPKLIRCLTLVNETDVIYAAVVCAGGILRAAGSRMVDYIADVATTLLAALSSPDLASKVKPPAVAVFGDMATALGLSIDEAMLKEILHVVNQAAQTSPEELEDNHALVDLRLGVLEAWTSICQVFLPSSEDTAVQKRAIAAAAGILRPFVPTITPFIVSWLQDVSNVMDEGDEESPLLGMVTQLIGLLVDLTGLVGKEEISSLVGTQHSPLLRRLLDYSDQQQRKEWDSPHDENGRRRMTATEYARKVLP